jgi:hypothetical protein
VNVVRKNNVVDVCGHDFHAQRIRIAQIFRETIYAFTLNLAQLSWAMLQGYKISENRDNKWKTGWYAVHTGAQSRVLNAKQKKHRVDLVVTLVERMVREGVCTYELVTAISPMKKYAAVLKSSCKRYGVQWDGRKHHTPLYDATKAAELFCQLPRVPDAARVKGVLECICNT